MLVGPKRSLLANTPPANEMARGRAARKQGEGAIKRDLLGGRGKRAGIFTVLSDGLIAQAEHFSTFNVRLFTKKDGAVYGTEEALFRPHASTSEMRAHHKKYFKNGRMTQAGGRTRDIGRWKFVDKMVVSKSAMDAYLKVMYARVGRFAASQLRGALDLGAGAKVPDWIKRHVMKGSARWIINDRVMICVITFEPIFAEDDAKRRIDYVRRYNQNALNRRLPYIIKAVLAKRSSGARATSVAS